MYKQEEAFKLAMESQFVKPISLGPWTTYSLLNDPKHMCFVLSRYKFCSKILDGKKNILEIGCGDGFGVPIIAANSDYVLALDSNEPIIESNKERLSQVKNIEFITHNICVSSIKSDIFFGGAFSIDVIEHLDPELEHSFMSNTCASLDTNGICIVGTPNIAASEHAIYRSEVQHINLKSHDSLRELMGQYFNNVLMFSMNDEVVHTGFGPMAHYLFSVGVGVKCKV